MIKRTILALCIFLVGVMGINAQESLTDRFANNKEITTVYLSKALLSMAGNIGGGKMEIASLAGKLESLEIYTSEKKSGVRQMKKEIEKLKSDKGYELLMKINDDGDDVVFYAKRGKNNLFKEVLMCVQESDESTIIRMMGQFSLEDIQKIAK